jgi:ABC-2 type transport system permease protein
MHLIEQFLAELQRTWIQFIRYPAEAIFGIFIYVFVFYSLFTGLQYVAGPGVFSSSGTSDRLEVIVIGYVLWSLLLYICNDVTFTLESEAKAGTLEQLFLTPQGAIQIFLVRSVASLTLRFLLLTIILSIILALTGVSLSFSPGILPPLLALLLSSYGFAFSLGALSLLFKQVQQVLGITQFLLLFLISAPTETWTGPIASLIPLLPIVPGAGLLRDVMARDLPLSLPGLAIALANGAFYLSIGLLLFRQAERMAKRRGLLAGY